MWKGDLLLLNKRETNPTLRLLLATTEDLIRQKGCSKLTMKDIIQQSGISKGGIYHYVESKDELFTMVLQTQLEKTRTQFLQRLEKGLGKEREWIDILLDHFYQCNQDPINSHILFYLLSKTDNLLVRQTIRSYYRQLVKTTIDWIHSGQHKGHFSTVVDDKKMADLFVLISLGYHIRSCIPSEAGYFSMEDFGKLIMVILKKT